MTTRGYLLVCCLCCCLASTPIAQAFPLISSDTAATVTLAEAPSGPKNGSASQLTKQLNARLKAYAETSAKTNGAGSQRYLRAERLILKKQLRALGYYEAHIEQLAQRRYRVETGPRYVIRQWQVEASALAGTTLPPLPLKQGQALLAEDVLQARNRIQAFFREQCFPQVKVSYSVVLDSEQHSADITYNVLSGPRAQVGAISFAGLVDIEEDFLRNSVELTQGKCLRYKELDRARLALLQTGLLSSVMYTVNYPPADNGETVSADVHFRTSERKSRSIKASLGYTTDAREGATLGWEHRNLFGDAERLELEGGIDQISRRALSKLTLPQFFHPRQELQLSAEIETEEPDAYLSRTRELAAIVSRHWRSGLHASVGVALTESRVIEEQENEHFSLLSLPLSMGVDRRNDLIDPHSGWAVDLVLRPFTEISQEDLDFVQSALTLRSYFTQKDWLWRPTLALRASAGSLTGAALESIPADQRFYVGGGGSVRGYPYQSVGELTDGKADGGKSYSEVSMELRLQFSKDWGGVVFADGGYAYPDKLPNLGADYLWGAGLGLRYFTRFAPLRVDVAFPLDRRDGVDNRLQLYISLGQAF